MMNESSQPTNRQIRVFISSTFRDMQTERDHLVKFIFPQLRKLCELFRQHLPFAYGGVIEVTGRKNKKRFVEFRETTFSLPIIVIAEMLVGCPKIATIRIEAFRRTARP